MSGSFLVIDRRPDRDHGAQLARMLTGADGADPADPASSEEHARRRASVVRAAQRLALAPGSINPLPGSGHGR